MTPDDPRIDLADSLLPLACELVATVRDYGPDDVRRVLERAAATGRLDALAVVLAAMVDPDAKPSALLDWTTRMPESRPYTPSSYFVKAVPRATRGEKLRTDVARLTANGLSATDIAVRLGIHRRSVVRIRAGIRERSQARIHRSAS